MNQVSSMTPKVYDQQTLCLYCRELFDEKKHPQPFSDEHIVPEGIGGTHVLPNAVCPSCRTLTSNTYEVRTIRSTFQIPRIILGVRRKKQRQRDKKRGSPSLPMVALGNNTVSIAEPDLTVTGRDFPQLFHLPKFDRAGFYTGIPNDDICTSFRVVLVDLGVTNKLPAGGVTVSIKIDFFEFAMTLIKMAYSYALANNLHLQTDINDIRDLIFGNRTDVFNFFGSFESDSDKTSELHTLSHSVLKGLVMVKLHLFSAYTKQSYMVVIGKSNQGPISVSGSSEMRLPAFSGNRIALVDNAVKLNTNYDNTHVRNPNEMFRANEIISDKMLLPKKNRILSYK